MIQLRAVRLVNWYGFANMTAPVGLFTLIAGKNGNGKSVLLDAIKYGLYGDTVFNKSTENKASRTLSSYTRGLLDATRGTYMRPAQDSPHVYTHIVLEFEQIELKRTFLLGTVLDTPASNNITTQRYIMDNMTLADMSHTYEKEGAVFAYSGAELHRRYKMEMFDANAGLNKFMQRTGLNLNALQLNSFKRKLRSIMSYNPNSKIDQFIRESVLEEKELKLTKLIEAKANIDHLNARLLDIENEITALDEIASLFTKVWNTKQALERDSIKRVYKTYVESKDSETTATYNIEVTERSIEENNRKIEGIGTEERALQKEYDEARLHLNESAVHKAVEAARNAVWQAEEEEKRVLQEKTALEELQERILRIESWYEDRAKEWDTTFSSLLMEDKSGAYSLDVHEAPPLINDLDRVGFIERLKGKESLTSLLSVEYSAVEKELAVAEFKAQLERLRDSLVGALATLKSQVDANYKNQDVQRQIIRQCDEKTPSFNQIPDFVGLKNDINKEFKKRGLSAEARFACEYVVALKDEHWRNTLEGYLGGRRYTILVPPEYYDIADDILNQSKYKYAHLFNTKLLMKKKVDVATDSVVQFLDIRNDVAKAYFNYQLGRFHAVEQGKVRNYENAMSVTGRVAVSMDSYFLDFKRIKFYCLGQESIEINRHRAEKELNRLKLEASEFIDTQGMYEEAKQFISRQTQLIGVYNFNAPIEYENALKVLQKRQVELQELELAKKNDNAYWELVTKVDQLEKALQSIGKARETIWQSTGDLKNLLGGYEVNLKEALMMQAESQARLEQYKATSEDSYRRALEEYNQFLQNNKTGKGDILKDKTRSNYEGELKGFTQALTSKQSAYNVRLHNHTILPEGDNKDVAQLYAARRQHIWIDDLQELKQGLRKQTEQYEDIFKKEFVLTVLSSCEQAMRDLKAINRELRQLDFKFEYAFDVKFVSDGSKFQEILQYAQYLQERENLGGLIGQMTLEDMVEHSDAEGAELEAKMQKLIGEIIGGKDSTQIERFADYRNYMTYEILITNDVVQRGKLSRQSGYNSGAEVQIPYMLILLSALLMIYNDKLNSTRLVFIDEPFAKMDPINVKTMLRFMRSQGLQMIFCAPDKTELIGSECEVVLPVLRTAPDMIQIGAVEMHEDIQ